MACESVDRLVVGRPLSDGAFAVKVEGSGSDMGRFSMPDGGDVEVRIGGERTVELGPA